MTNALNIPPAIPSLGQAFRYWFHLGLISFGGPAGQIAIMHMDLVEKKCWISEQRFLHALNYCMVLPGPEAIQLAIYISWLMHGVLGAVMAGILFFLPAFFLLSALAGIYLAWGDLPWIQGIFYGIKPAVVAIVLFAAWRIGSKVLNNKWLWSIATLAFMAVFFFKISFPWVVLVAVILGVLGGKLYPDKFQSSHAHNAVQKSYGAAVIDNHSPTPKHAQFSWRKLMMTLVIFLAIWVLALLAVGGQSTLQQMGLFFTKAAFLTIGGAYAVLPYVYQGGVEHYTWLTGAQMMDGLALGEATPGPLIMIVTWIGYIGGVTKQVVVNPLLAGVMGATVATFFTFLPSFFFIIAGGPIVESTRGDLKFTAPLTAITAAVVGVIVNLALFFAWHTFWPSATEQAPFAGVFDYWAVLLAVVSFLALWRYKVEVTKVIAMSAVVGLVFALVKI